MTDSHSLDRFDVLSVLKLDTLNPAQRAAVETTEGPLLVLAGAGSGKTRVLTHRIAYLILKEHVRPWQILAITFTNKAASEMRERLEQLLPFDTRGMWVSTFHAMCVRILREHADLLGYTSDFTIYDTDDLKRLIKTIMADLDIDPKEVPVAGIMSKISRAKNAGRGPRDLEESSNRQDWPAGRVYRQLIRRLQMANAMDFDDLLLKTRDLFAQYPEVLANYQERFRYICVDEYQDTNVVQYELTNALARAYQNLMVVGDDDQSIYSWRGADITNILAFERDYPTATVIKLEQNYRSSAHILEAANAVVAHNTQRKAKRLFTEAQEGEKIGVYQATDELDEGRWIGAEIEKLHDKGREYDEMAVFYRTNAQSRALEDMLLRAGVPYRLVGGTRFYDRAEIRDVMAYLKVVINPHDDVSVARIINTPRRGIGTTSIRKVQEYAFQHRLSLFEAFQHAATDSKLLTAKTRASVASFLQIIEDAQQWTGDLAHIVDHLVEATGLIHALNLEHTVEAESRIENIQEFIGVAAEFAHDHVDLAPALESVDELIEAGIVSEEENINTPVPVIPAPPTPQVKEGYLFAEEPPQPRVRAENPLHTTQLPAFIEWLALRSDLDTLAGAQRSVTMMTIHAAKGLEFPIVFVAGLEENLFPHMQLGESEAKLEEERRLAYVAITRAREQLYLTYAMTRHVYGNVSANPPSRFLQEIPEEHLEQHGLGSRGFAGVGWAKRGDRHGTFGSGRGADVYGGHIFGTATRSTPGSEQSRRTRDEASALSSSRSSSQTIEVGDKVSHKTFGMGIVIAASTDTLEISFEKTGQVKKLLKGFAPIVKIDEA